MRLVIVALREGSWRGRGSEMRVVEGGEEATAV
jgi:hypothetical protein